jgi:hypothetical protein
MLINPIRSNHDRGNLSIYEILRIHNVSIVLSSMLILTGGNLGVRYGQKNKVSISSSQYLSSLEKPKRRGSRRSTTGFWFWVDSVVKRVLLVSSVSTGGAHDWAERGGEQNVLSSIHDCPDLFLFYFFYLMVSMILP